MGVPPTRFGGFPVTALSHTRLNLHVNSSLGQPRETSVVCDISAVDGLHRDPKWGYPPRISQPFNMAALKTATVLVMQGLTG